MSIKALFILFVLIIAKGWPVTKHEISAKPLIFFAWILYIIIEIALFVWIKVFISNFTIISV